LQALCDRIDLVLMVLRDLQEQVESLLIPVIRAYEDRMTQLRMDAFVTRTHRFAKIRSKRLKAAAAGALGRDLDRELVLSDDECATGRPACGSDKPQNGRNSQSTRKRARESGRKVEGSTVSEKRGRQVPGRADGERSHSAGQASNGKRLPENTHSDEDDVLNHGEYVDQSLQSFFF
jgi:hypothetical protein